MGNVKNIVPKILTQKASGGTHNSGGHMEIYIRIEGHANQDIRLDVGSQRKSLVRVLIAWARRIAGAIWQ